MSRYALIAEPDLPRASECLSLLAELGLDTVLARDGAEARDVLQLRGPPALLVTELALPKVDGFALLTELRSKSPAPSTAVLVRTAYDELRNMAWPHRERLGIHGFLSRHASASTLREAFRGALEGQPAPVPGAVTLASVARVPVAPPPAPAPTASGPLSAPQAELTDVVTAVAEAFGVPAAILTLEHEGQRRSVAHVTLPQHAAGAQRDWSLFHHAVQGPEGLVVPDATKHPLLREDPLVLEGALGSYAGALLVTPSGRKLGTLCILDARRRALGPEELGVLLGLARRIAGELETQARTRATELEAARLRGALEARASGAESLEALREALHAVDAAVLLVDGEGRALVANERLGELLDVPSRELAGLSLEAVRQHLANLCADPQAALRRLEPSSGPSVTLAMTLELERPRARVVRWVARPVRLPGGLGQLSTFTDVTHETAARAQPAASRTAGSGR